MLDEDPQNEPGNVCYLAASQSFFERAEMWRTMDLLVVAALPTLGALYGATQANPNFIIPFVGFLGIVLDGTLFQPFIRSNRIRAAQLAETYDCRIIGEEPSPVRTWGRPSDEEVQSVAERHLRKPGAREWLRFWYTDRLHELTSVPAQLLCQRISCSWDEQLRQRYIPVLAIIAVSVALLLVVFFGEAGWALNRAVTNVLYPIAPAIAWLGREFIEHQEARTAKERLRMAIQQVWARMIQGAGELTAERDAIQGMQFMFRATQPSVPSRLYRANRDRDRVVFRTTIESYIREAVAANLGTGPRPAPTPLTEG